MKTVLQEYIDWLNKHKVRDKLLLSNEEIITKATELLDKEKEQMIAFGKKCFYKGYEKSDMDDANCFTAWREEGQQLIYDQLQ